ncbi:STAS domain-containing protein [Umezawaea sp.]|uniref:STAS domain-containing protein n=1 Tax=Umezawaea sp. TaxID=1955258 RepID=UPI002ED31C67
MQPEPQHDLLTTTAHAPDVLAVAGELDTMTVAPLRDAVTALIQRTPAAGTAVLDFSAVTHFGSSGIELLLQARGDLLARRAALRVVPSRQVTRVLAMMSLDRLLELHRTRAEALAS